MNHQLSSELNIKKGDLEFIDPNYLYVKVKALLNVAEQKLMVRTKNINLVIQLKGGRIEELNDNIFMILEGKNKFRFKACSMEEKQLWVNSVHRAIFINDSAMVKVEIHPVGLTK